MQFAELSGPRGPIQVYGLVMDAWWFDESQARQHAVRELLTRVGQAQDKRAPLIICGDFNTDPDKTCGNACSANPDCSEFSNYKSRSDFRLVMVDKTGGGRPVTRFIQANASTAAQFDPVLIRGKTIRSFSGTLRYCSGGKQFTIEARCADDIVADPKGLPVPSDTACVKQRTIFDVNAGSN